MAKQYDEFVITKLTFGETLMRLPNDALYSVNICTNKLLNSVSWLSIVMIMYCVSGCASTVSFTPVDFCSQPVNPAMARIVFSRSSSIVGAPEALGIFDSDQPIGSIGPGGKLCWDRFPGKALIVGRNVIVGSNVYTQTGPNWKIEIDTKANGIYYVHGSVTGTWKLSSTPD